MGDRFLDKLLDRPMDFRMSLTVEEIAYLASFAKYAEGEPLPSYLDIEDRISDVPYLAQYMFRDEYRKRFGYAMPCKEMVEAVNALNVPLVSIGSGSGYLERVLQVNGVDIIATDVHPPTSGKNYYQPNWPEFTKIRRRGAVSAVKRYPTRAIFTSWPNFRRTWAYEAAMALRPGNYLVYVGEWKGCTADHQFHDLLGERFEEVGEVNIPQFDGAHDCCWIFRKKSVHPVDVLKEFIDLDTDMEEALRELCDEEVPTGARADRS